MRETQSDTDDPYLLVFIDCLLASADYDSFYKVMAKEGRKRALARKADAKAEAKSPERDFEKETDGKRSEGKADSK